MNNPQLVPGSIWSKSGSEVTVIAVSNESLSPELLERFPQQVIYINNKLQINTQPLESFAKKRVYSGINQDIASLVASMVDPILDEEEEEVSKIDFEDTELSVQEEDLQPFQDLAADAVVSESDESSIIPVFETPGWESNLPLDESFVSYTEAPAQNGDTLHILRFSLAEGLSVSDLDQAFGLHETSITKFVVDCFQERVEVTIDGYMGVFMEVDADANAIGAVYVSSPGKFRLLGAELDAAVKEAAAAIESIDLSEEDEASTNSQIVSISGVTTNPPTYTIPQVQVSGTPLLVSTGQV